MGSLEKLFGETLEKRIPADERMDAAVEEPCAEEVEGVKSAVEKKLKGNAYVSKAKRDNPRKVELTVLKNRQGATTGSAKGIPLTYWPRTNLFVEG